MPLDAVSTSRTELSAIAREIEAATADRDEIQRRHDRISAPAIELQKTVASLACAKAEYDAEIVAWYESGCPGDRPQTPGALLSLEHAVGVLKSDIIASDDAVKAAAAALDDVNSRIGGLAARKRSTLYAVIIEVARVYLRERCISAMVASLTELSVVESLAAELRGFGINDPEALSAARAIEQAIFETRSSVAVRGDMAAAKAFLAELAGNPIAEIPAPQQAEVVHLDPPVMRPLEDGSVYINRGTPEPPAEPAVRIPFLEPLPWATMEAT